MKGWAVSEGKRLVPRLRFPEFASGSTWEGRKVDDLVDTVTPPKKLPTSAYSTSGDFPIVDQSQSLICGWTNDSKALIQDDLPLIIFGDHTCILKLVNHPFVQGADGIKILKPRPAINTSYLYQFLGHQPVVTEEYKRHYSILKEKVVLLPVLKTGEQQKIADCLSSLDELIAAQARKVDALKAHKEGLMQQLFPREGETRPRLRFLPFRKRGAWTEVVAGDIFSNRVERGDAALPIYSVTMFNGLVPRKSLDRRIDDIAESSANKKVCKGDIAYNMMRMWQGAMGIAAEDCMVSPAYIVLRPKSADTQFFYYLLKQPHMLRVLTAHSRGLTEDRLRLYYDGFSKIPLLYPSPEEQSDIAGLLTSIDKLVAIQEQELDTLKTHKKGLMQQLFPAAEAVEA